MRGCSGRFSVAVLALFGYVIYVFFEIGRQSTIR